MAKKPDAQVIEGEFRVRGERQAAPTIRCDWRQNPAPWTPPTPDEYGRLFRFLIGIGAAATIGVLRAWWTLHYH